MLAQKASEIAKEAMGKGHNCCEAVLMAANEVWSLKLSPDTLAAGVFFKEGMGSGCSCGALVGLVMISGILSRKYPHPLGKELAPYLYRRFKEQFGSSCCRVLCSNRPLRERIGKKGCKILTGNTATLMVEVWGEVIRGTEQNFRNYTNAQ
jgi:C_GCAxxG_C_C family probable redox protein